jgi:hypothetical protein
MACRIGDVLAACSARRRLIVETTNAESCVAEAVKAVPVLAVLVMETAARGRSVSDQNSPAACPLGTFSQSGRLAGSLSVPDV